MAERNPFKPTAGATPPLLVGRADVLDEISESIEDGPGAPSRLVRFTGARGVGKTVMLTETRKVANQLGWVSISETATPGLTARLTAAAQRARRRLDSTPSGRRLSGVTLPAVAGFGGGGVTFEPSEREEADLRQAFGLLLDELEPRETGLFITIDEVHSAARDELRHVAATFQHLVTEGRDLALAVAGLPSAVSDLLQDDVLTFLRRATPYELADVALEDVRAALSETITSAGRSITETALARAAEATGGYPFMIQLVGYHVWRKATGDLIDDAAVDEGVPAAQKRLGNTVHETALGDLSDVDRTVLLAMAEDDGPSSTSALAARLGVEVGYIGVYRRRLIEAGMIEEAGYGSMTFALPFLREYLRDHAARWQMSQRRLRRTRTPSS